MKSKCWVGVKEKEYSMALVKDSEADFIQDYHNRHRNHCSGILQWGGEINSQFSIQQWQVRIYSHGASGD